MLCCLSSWFNDPCVSLVPQLQQYPPLHSCLHISTALCCSPKVIGCACSRCLHSEGQFLWNVPPWGPNWASILVWCYPPFSRPATRGNGMPSVQTSGHSRAGLDAGNPSLSAPNPHLYSYTTECHVPRHTQYAIGSGLTLIPSPQTPSESRDDPMLHHPGEERCVPPLLSPYPHLRPAALPLHPSQYPCGGACCMY